MNLHLLIIFGVLAAYGHSQQCNRQIEVGKTEAGNLTIPLQSSGLTCLIVSPPDDENKFVLLKLPASLSITLNGKIYESNDASSPYCFLMTPNKRCPLWHEKIRDRCPGGATAQPIFGKTVVYVKTVAGSSHGGSNETIVQHDLIHRRFGGFIHGECTDLEPPTVAPTTFARTLPDTTVIVTSTIPTEAPQTEEVTDGEPTFKSTPEPPKPTTQIPSGKNGEEQPISDGLLIAIILLAVVSMVGVCGLWAYFRKNDRNCKSRCTSQDTEKRAADPNFLESRRRLVSVNGSAASTSPHGSRDTVSFQKETGEE